MRRKLVVTAVVALLMAGLAGCSLPWGSVLHPATPAPGITASRYGDKLIGIYATTAPLDLTPDQRVYATITPSDDVDGTMPAYAFKGLDGFAMFMADMQDATGTYCHADASLTDVACDYSLDDETATGGTSTSLAMAGTLNMAPSGSVNFVVGYPILQTTDGRVYVVNADDSPAVSAGSIGATMTMSLADTRTVGGVTVYSAVITFNVKLRAVPSQITVLAMSGSDVVLSHTDYAPGTLPDEIRPPAGTSYIIVKTEAADSSVSREVLGPDAPSLVTYAARGDGVLIAQTTTINWA